MRQRTFAVICACLCALGLSAQASDDDTKDEAAMRASDAALGKGHYLAAQEALTSRAFDGQGKPRDNMTYSNWSLFQAFIGNEPAPAISWSPAAPSASVVAAIAHARPADPIAEIVRHARTTRIVILNEDHWVPRDRAFALQVARALRPLGYDVLAAETFNNSPDPAFADQLRAKLEQDGYPRRGSGYYTQDPVFGDFVRQALHLGYRPVLYEATNFVPGASRYDSIARRDQQEADNLLERALKAHPNSKILIYVGFHHATEAPMPFDNGKGTIEWMATRLKRMSGIDPLTIDQTVLSPLSSGNPALYALVAPRLRGRPAMLMANGAPLVLGEYAGKVDLQVAHPVATRIDGRPDWLRSMGRRPVAVPANLIPRTGMRLIKAYVASEAEDAVPVDQVLVTAGKPVPKLMLPPGRIRYEVEDAAG